MASHDVERTQFTRLDESSKEDRIRLILRSIFHFSVYLYNIFLFIYSVIFCVKIYDHEVDKVSELSRYVWGFITNWNAEFQAIFLLLSVVFDVLEWRGSHHGHFGKKLRHYRDLVFCAFVAPYTPFVTLLFWSLYWIDKELIYPSVLDPYVPWWLNHCIHTNIIIIYLVEVVLQPRRKPTNAKVENICVATVGILYTIVYYSIHFFAHRWLYNVFNVLTWWQIILLQGFAFLVIYVFYRLQYPLNRLFHKKEKERAAKMIDVNGWKMEENGKKDGIGVENGKDDSAIPFINNQYVAVKTAGKNFI